MKKQLVVIITLLICFGMISCKQKPLTIHLIGDSTMANKKAEVFPETGWGMVFNEYFDDEVTVHNHAVNGRSTKSFIDEGKWQAVLDSLKEGDYVFIQFGHNDEKINDSTRYTVPYETYSDNLRKYVSESREKGAKPILLTSIVRRKFDKNGALKDTHGDYPEAMRKVAIEMDVPLIDLQKLTEQAIQEMGDEPSKQVYLWVEPSENFPDGKRDDTHLNVKGAHLVAELVINDLKKQSMKLASYLK